MLILLSACGAISRMHCCHEEYGLGARGRIYGASKVHHAGFSPACGSWDEAKVSTNSVMKTAHDRRKRTMCKSTVAYVSRSWVAGREPMIVLFGPVVPYTVGPELVTQGQDFGGEEPLRQGAGLAMVAITTLMLPWQIGCVSVFR